MNGVHAWSCLAQTTGYLDPILCSQVVVGFLAPITIQWYTELSNRRAFAEQLGLDARRLQVVRLSANAVAASVALIAYATLLGQSGALESSGALE
jgi:hypothetical protein